MPPQIKPSSNQTNCNLDKSLLNPHKASANGRISESSHCSHHRELKQPKMQKRILGSTAQRSKHHPMILFGGFIMFHPAPSRPQNDRLLHTARTTATYLLEVLLVIPGPGGSSEIVGNRRKPATPNLWAATPKMLISWNMGNTGIPMIQQVFFGGNKHKNMDSSNLEIHRKIRCLYMFSAGFTWKSYGFKHVSTHPQHRHSPSPAVSPAWSGYRRCGRRSGATNVQVSWMTWPVLVVSRPVDPNMTHGLRWKKTVSTWWWTTHESWLWVSSPQWFQWIYMDLPYLSHL